MVYYGNLDATSPERDSDLQAEIESQSTDSESEEILRKIARHTPRYRSRTRRVAASTLCYPGPSARRREALSAVPLFWPRWAKLLGLYR